MRPGFDQIDEDLFQAHGSAAQAIDARLRRVDAQNDLFCGVLRATPFKVIEFRRFPYEEK